MLDGQKGLESALGDRLEAAGLALKPAEWLLMHVGIAVGLGIVGLLLGGGSVLFMLVGLLLGARRAVVLPAPSSAAGGSRRSTPSSPTPCS